MGYTSLFISALLSATLLPGSSEVVLGTLMLKPEYQVLALWTAATLGNVLGSCVNYWLGTQASRYQDRAWFPVSAKGMARAQYHFDRYGKLSLLFAWLPVVGDPLTLIGGLFRVPLMAFLFLVGLGKGIRYALVIMTVQGITLI